MTTTFTLPESPTYSLSEFKFLQDPNDKTSKLGSGSFATVKLAREKKTNKLFALKMMNVSSSKTSVSDLMNLKTEITLHQKLHHDNVIKYHGAIQQDPYVYLVLEYADHGNLYSYIHRSKKLSESEVFKCFYQTCLAIEYLHNNDVMHRDIKPENLLLDKNNNVKLCDFGWSTTKITKKRTTFCGTFEYMAPEIVHKIPYDNSVDIWSLGILLYELLHREAPYKGRSLAEITKSLNRKTFNISASVNPAAANLIQKILKIDPLERPSLQEIFAHPWVQSHLISYKKNQRPAQSSVQDSKTLYLKTLDEKPMIPNHVPVTHESEEKGREDQPKTPAIEPLKKPTPPKQQAASIEDLEFSIKSTIEIPSLSDLQETPVAEISAFEKALLRVTTLKINVSASNEASSLGYLDGVCSPGSLTCRKLEISSCNEFHSFSEMKCLPSSTVNSKQNQENPSQNSSLSPMKQLETPKNSILSPDFRLKLTDIMNQLSRNNGFSQSFASLPKDQKTPISHVRLASPISNQLSSRDNSKSNLTSSASGDSTGPTTPLNPNFQTQRKHTESFKVSSKVELPKIRNLYGTTSPKVVHSTTSFVRKIEPFNSKCKGLKYFGSQKSAGLPSKH